MAYAVRRPVENPYLVRERDRKRSRELLALGLSLLPPLAVLFAAAWANLETVRLGYQLESLQSQKEGLEKRQRELLARRSSLSSLQRVDAAARDQLHLGPPRADQVILVRDASLAGGAAVAVAPRATPAPDLPELFGPAAPIRTEEGF